MYDAEKQTAGLPLGSVVGRAFLFLYDYIKTRVAAGGQFRTLGTSSG